MIALLSAFVPVLYTSPVSTDPDDPAIWRNRKLPSQSRVIVTDKTSAPAGSVYVFDLQGRQVQRIANVDRPNNVDVEYGFRAGTATWDIAVATERNRRRLRIFRIRPADGKLVDVSGETGVFPDGTGDQRAPMGISMYRKQNGEISALVSRKEHTGRDVIAEYALVFRGGRVDTRLKRYLGHAKGEVEALLVDDEQGKLYYAEEAVGYYRVDLNTGQNDLLFGTEKYDADREGIALYRTGKQTGWLVTTEQRPNSTRYRLYRRENPSQLERIFTSTLDDTDGIEITSESLGPRFPHGLFVAMNSGSKNFAYFFVNFLRQMDAR